jgi:hypothetical protein
MDLRFLRFARWTGALAAALSVGSCAAFQQLLSVEPPRFEVVRDRPSVLTLDPTSILSGRPLASVRIWARVTNPNTFGLTLSRLRGDLFLEDREMADVDLPLGLPLLAARDTVIPIDIRFGLPTLSSLGALGEALLRRSAVDYKLDGTVGIDAGGFGQPTFGPRTWLQGQFEVRTGIQ